MVKKGSSPPPPPPFSFFLLRDVVKIAPWSLYFLLICFTTPFLYWFFRSRSRFSPWLPFFLTFPFFSELSPSNFLESFSCLLRHCKNFSIPTFKALFFFITFSPPWVGHRSICSALGGPMLIVNPPPPCFFPFGFPPESPCPTLWMWKPVFPRRLLLGSFPRSTFFFFVFAMAPQDSLSFSPTLLSPLHVAISFSLRPLSQDRSYGLFLPFSTPELLLGFLQAF